MNIGDFPLLDKEFSPVAQHTFFVSVAFAGFGFGSVQDDEDMLLNRGSSLVTASISNFQLSRS